MLKPHLPVLNSFLIFSLLSTASITTSASFASKQSPLNTSFSEPIAFIPPIPPGERQAEEDETQQVDLGSRGPGDEGYLTALVPAQGLTLTTASHPSFWVYLPGMADDIESMEFLLRHRQSGQIESFSVEQPSPNVQSSLPGVVELTLPTSAAPLKIDEVYDWSLIVNYHIPSQGSGIGLSYEHFVVASVQRQVASAELEADLAQVTTPREQAAAYAKHGIWHESLTSLGNHYRSNPDDLVLATDWASLLMAVDLESHPHFPFAIPFDSNRLSQRAIVQCCSLDDAASVAQEP
ncbi:MAG: DUF928 domain-containing protein [Cyanobacteria bacterium P01_F01_bin.150]